MVDKEGEFELEGLDVLGGMKDVTDGEGNS